VRAGQVSGREERGLPGQWDAHVLQQDDQAEHPVAVRLDQRGDVRHVPPPTRPLGGARFVPGMNIPRSFWKGFPGMFDSEVDTAQAYSEWVRRECGEFAYLNPA
jgi:hypothetical protein